MKLINTLKFSLLISASAFVTALSAEPLKLVAGQDYQVTAAKGSEQPMLEEFFNYACSHCYQMEEFMSNFAANNPGITVKPVPMELRPAWKIYVKAYYLGEKLGVLAQSHGKIFHRLHVENKPFKDEDDMKAFFLGLGVEEKDYDEVANSYWLDTQLRLAKQYAFKNKVMSTPTMLVNQQYVLDLPKLGSLEKVEQAIKQLSGANDTAVAAQ